MFNPMNIIDNDRKICYYTGNNKQKEASMNKTTANKLLQGILGILKGKITLNEEADKIKYFAFADIPSNAVQKQIPRIKDVLDNPDKFHMKEQFGKSTKQLIKDGWLQK